MTTTLRSTLPLTAICVLTLATPAVAVDLFVKPTGSGSACVQSSPCTLATALATAAVDDTIHVAAGVYTGTGTEVVLLDKTVSLLGGWSGAPSGAVVRDPVAYESVLDGEYARRVVKITGGAPTLDGLTIRRGNASGLTAGCGSGYHTPAGCGGGVFISSAGATVRNAQLTDNVAVSTAVNPNWGGYGGGLYAYRSTTTMVEGCIFRGNVGSAAGNGNGGGVQIVDSNGPVEVRGSRFIGNQATSFDGKSGFGGGISIIHCIHEMPIVESNVFHDNVARATPYNSSTSSDGNAIFALGSRAVVRGNAVRSDAHGFAVAFTESDVEVAGNTVIADSENSALYFYNGHGSQSVVTNNVLVGGSNHTVRAHNDNGNPVRLLMSHNTVIGGAALVGIIITSGTEATLTNNLVAGAAQGIVVNGTGAASVDYTLFWNNVDDGVRGTNPIDGDPMFVNAPAGDFHIQAGSAAIGVGIDTGVATDIDGEARPGLGGVDVGADELAPRAFDFGTPASPIATGFTQVTHATTFTPERGFGWNYGTIASRDRGAGNDDRRRDFCFTHTGTFAVTVPNGRYRATLTMGDASAGHGQMAVFLENVKVATVSTAGNEFKELTSETAVTDGELTVWLNDEGGSDPNAVINALVIEPALPVMVDLGTAASPLAAGYTRGTHATVYSPGAGFGWQGGILQSRDRGTADALLRDLVFTPRGLLGVFVPNGVYDVLLTLGDASGAHNLMGVSVQGAAFDQVSTAKNQFVTRRYRTLVADNRLDVLLDDLEGPDVNTVLNAVAVRPPAAPAFDFGTPTSAVRIGYLRVSHQTTYSAQLGYGWTSGTIGSRDRGAPWNIWYRDFNFTADGTFVVDLLPGRYVVTLGAADSAANHDQFAVEIEGVRVETFTALPAGTSLARTYEVSVLDGQLTVRLVDLGGVDANAVINVLTVR